MDQQFSLSWNNFHGNLTKGFAGLLGNSEFVDVTIAVDGHLLQAHKAILSICSPYFKKMFQLNPCQHPIVVLRDVTHKAMRDLLQFMYHGEVSVKREDLTTFIGTAEVLQIKGLTNKETEDDEIRKKPELSKYSTDAPKAHSPEAEPSATDLFECNTNDEVPQNVEFNLLKQREFLEKLQRLSNLKRKSEELIQKNYYTEILSAEKRAKIREKPTYRQNIMGISNYEKRNPYEDNPLDATHIVKPMGPASSANEEANDKQHGVPDNVSEIKTECDDMDIIVTDPAICTPPKSFDASIDGNKDPSPPLDYPSPQDRALSLVMNGSCESQQLPAPYKYIYSRKGHKQLVHMNFVYTKHSTTHGKTSWRCVQYFSLNRCPATVETVDAVIVAVNHQHNHEDCFEKLARNNIYYEISTSPK